MADKVPSQSRKSDGWLTYDGEVWRVESEPVVVESDGESVLVEVWVRRGENNGESSKG